MSRLAVITLHLGALPGAVLLSLAIARAVPGVSRQAIDIHLDDTFFVVAHFHVSIILAVSVVAVTLVAYRYRTINGFLVASWVLFVTHAMAAAVPWGPPEGVPSAEPGVFVTRTPSHPGLAFLYLASGLATVCALLVGLFVSLWRALRAKGEAAR